MHTYLCLYNWCCYRRIWFIAEISPRFRSYLNLCYDLLQEIYLTGSVLLSQELPESVMLFHLAKIHR
jgi:hypothetical protein